MCPVEMTASAAAAAAADDLELSLQAQAALQDFYQQKEERIARFQKLKEESERYFGGQMDPFEENWQLSQFWYSDDTATRMANEVLSALDSGARIACISAPTLFTRLKFLSPRADACLLEYDGRFSVFGDAFVPYDYRRPLHVATHESQSALPAHSFDFIFLDPPFLSEECFRATAQTVHHLKRPGARIMVCTGRVMARAVEDLFAARATRFLPKHANHLSNEFSCFANYETSFGWDE